MAFDETGYTPETQQDILEAMSAEAVALNANLDPSSNALMGIVLGLISTQLAQQYQHIAEIHSSLDPDTAEGKALDVLAWRNGLIRKDGETDDQLRIRVKRFLSAGGNSTVQAMYAQISNIDGVIDVNIEENDTKVEVSRGGRTPNPDLLTRPPSCFEVAVEGGDDLEIARIIRLTKPAGIQAFGETVVSSESELGAVRAIGFTRAVTLDVRLRLTYNLYNEELFPYNGEELIKEALVEFASEEYVLGKDILEQRIIGKVHDTVRGIHSVQVEVAFEGTGYFPGSQAIASFEKVTLTEDNITLVRT